MVLVRDGHVFKSIWCSILAVCLRIIIPPFSLTSVLCKMEAKNISLLLDFCQTRLSAPGQITVYKSHSINRQLTDRCLITSELSSCFPASRPSPAMSQPLKVSANESLTWSQPKVIHTCSEITWVYFWPEFPGASTLENVVISVWEVRGEG